MSILVSVWEGGTYYFYCTYIVVTDRKFYKLVQFSDIMDLLILDESVNHGKRSITEHVESWVRLHGYNLVEANDFENAKKMVSSTYYPLVFIHHFLPGEVDELRAVSPKTKFVAYSASLAPPSLVTPGSIAESLRKELAKHYDYLMHDLDECVEDALKLI